MPLILASNSASGGYEVDNSLRFNSGSTDYLNRTQGTPTSNQKFTVSAWYKRTNLATAGDIWSIGSNGDGLYVNLKMDGSDNLIFVGNDPLNYYLFSTVVYRDVSAWYHVVLAVDTTQATNTNRMKLYINGSELTSYSTATYPSQNYAFPSLASGQLMFIGRRVTDNAELLNGYLSEYYFIDGQQLTPSSFGETDTLTGIWKPKAYTGSFGTNGFYLEFQNSAALGTDSSGNGNNFTVNNLTSIDQTTDTCTNNWCTLNAVDNIASSGSGTLTQGNTNVSYTGGNFNTNATIAANKGKWYWETKAVANTLQGFVGTRIGFQEIPNTYSSFNTLENASFSMYVHPTAGVYSVVNGSNVSRGAGLTYADGDIIGIALDLDNNISYWYKNGSLSVTYDFSALSTIGAKNIVPAVGNASGSANPELNVNFGNPSLAGGGYADADGFGNFGYAVPAGYFALCTKNLAEYA